MQSKRGSDEARTWSAEMARRVGDAVRRARLEVVEMSAVQLSERTKELGYPITRGTIAKIESGSRGGKLDLAELVVLARALEVPPISLIYPGLMDREVEIVPGVKDYESEAALWFTGEAAPNRTAGVVSLYALGKLDGLTDDQMAQVYENTNYMVEARPLSLVRQYRELQSELNETVDRLARPDPSPGPTTSDEMRELLERRMHSLQSQIRALVKVMRDEGLEVSDFRG